MKKKGLIALLISLVMMLSVFTTACGGPKTIEEYVKNDKEAQEQLDKVAENQGLAVEITGNDVIYTYDISSIDGVTEEVGTSDLMKDQLASALDGVSDQFVGLCKQLEEESKITGVQIIINYTYGDTVLVNKTFNSSGPVE